MPKLPVLTGRQVMKALERAGFAFERQRGSHAVLINRQTRRCAVVPLHGGRDIPPGTLRGILRQAGLTVDELHRLLR